MKTRVWKTYVGWILFAEAVGGLSGWLIRDGVRQFGALAEQPPLSPPGVVFPIVWGILYALMGVGMVRVSLTPESFARAQGRNAFLLQLGFNFFWSIIFFNFRTYGFALIWLVILWGLILRMILTFRRTDRPAAWLQIPYLLWVSFAAYLNFGVWILNG